MPICHHGASLLAQISRPPMSMKSFHSLGIAGNSLRFAYPTPKNSRVRRLQKRRMGSYPFGQVWHPGHGIVFASKKQQEIVYPELNMAKLLHISTRNGATGEERSIATEEHEEIFSTAPERMESPDFGESTTDNAPLQHSGNGTPKETAGDTVNEVDVPAKPPFTCLDFKISEKAFHEARKAPEGSAASFWSYTLYRGPEDGGVEQKVKVHYCRSKHTMERVCQYFLDEEVIGFDLEWVADSNKHSGARRNVSLIQMASQSRIALFHIALYPKNDDFVAPTFRKIMEDTDVSKVGVAIKADCTRLRNYLGVETKGIFELSHLYKLVKYSSSGHVNLVNKRLVTLATQVQEHLRLPLFKGQDVRSSDWTLPLNMSQIIYSASDAYAGLQLYYVLDEEREALDPCPPRPYHAERNLPIRLADGVSISTIDESTEAIDVEGDNTTTGLSTAMMATAEETVQIEIEGESDSIIIAKPKPRAAPKRLKDARVIAADAYLVQYRTSKPNIRAAPSAIRTYYIWKQNNDLGPESIAKLLRDPPLQTNTVVSYILDAIRLESLPFEKKRLREEVLSLLPAEVLEGRYRVLVKEAQEPQSLSGT